MLLIDDGSTDTSPAICDGYAKTDSRVRVIHKENGGVSSARNLGITLAKGDLIAFVDSDDYLDLDMYEILIRNLDQTESDVSACNFCRELSGNVQWKEKQLEIPQVYTFCDHEIYNSITRKTNSIEGQVTNKIWKREVINGHRFRTDVAINDDAVYTWEAMKDAHRACFCDLPMYHYVMLPTSIVHSSKLDKFLKGLFGYEIMIEDAKTIPGNCYSDLCTQYISWNVTTFEHWTLQKPHEKATFEKIRKNIQDKKEYIKFAPFYHKTIARLIIFNCFIAECAVKIKIAVKNLKLK